MDGKLSREAKVITTQKYSSKSQVFGKPDPTKASFSSLHYCCPLIQRLHLASYWVSTSVVSIQTQKKMAALQNHLFPGRWGVTRWWRSKGHQKCQVISQPSIRESSGEITQQGLWETVLNTKEVKTLGKSGDFSNKSVKIIFLSHAAEIEQWCLMLSHGSVPKKKLRQEHPTLN